MIEDLSKIAGEAMSLIKAHQIEKAAKLVRDKHRAALTSSFNGRQQTVHEVTLALVETRAQRDKVLQTVDELPKQLQPIARAQVENICRELFDPQILELQALKRKISRPR